MFGRLKGKRKTVFEKGISNKKQIETLGKIPSTIRYIDSLTVFNTHINPYRKYELANNNVVVAPEKRNAAASIPDSTDVHTLVPFEKTEYSENVNFFKPTEKNFEEIPLDDNLFELSGVVDLNTAFNDDTTNFGLAKKKTVIKDTLIEKKTESVTHSTIQSTSNQDSFVSEQSSRSYSSTVQPQKNQM